MEGEVTACSLGTERHSTGHITGSSRKQAGQGTPDTSLERLVLIEGAANISSSSEGTFSMSTEFPVSPHVETAGDDVTRKPVVEIAEGPEVGPHISTLWSEVYMKEQDGSQRVNQPDTESQRKKPELRKMSLSHVTGDTSHPFSGP